MRCARYTVLAAAFAVFTGCTVGPVKPFAATPNRAVLNDDEKSVWEASKEQDEAFQNMGAVYDDPALTAYVQGIVNKLYPEFNGTIRVHLMRSPVPNAFMMANGSCYVQLGLLPLLHDEAQLAIVLGHEGIHFTDRHGYQEHGYAVNSAVVGIMVGMVIPIVPVAMAYSSIAGYSVQMEAQADQEGYARFLKAGYSAQDSPAPFEALDAYTTALGIKESYFYADHPKMQLRIAYFKAQAAKAPPGGITGRDEYLKASLGAREWVLQELLARKDYKVLVFLLEDPGRRAEYPGWVAYYLGRAYQMRDGDGDAARAEQEYREVIAQSPDYAPSYEALGRQLMARGGHDAEAAQMLSTYLKLQPDASDRGYIEAYIKRLNAKAATQQSDNPGKTP